MGFEGYVDVLLEKVLFARVSDPLTARASNAYCRLLPNVLCDIVTLPDDKYSTMTPAWPLSFSVVCVISANTLLSLE